MSKKTSAIHYNNNVRDMTIELFLKGKSCDEIEYAIRKMVRTYRSSIGR